MLEYAQLKLIQNVILNENVLRRVSNFNTVEASCTWHGIVFQSVGAACMSKISLTIRLSLNSWTLQNAVVKPDVVSLSGFRI